MGKKGEETKKVNELIEQRNKDLSDKIKEDSLGEVETKGKEQVSKIRIDDTKKQNKKEFKESTKTVETGAIDIIEAEKSKELTNESVMEKKGIHRGEQIKDSQILEATSSSI